MHNGELKSRFESRKQLRRQQTRDPCDNHVFDSLLMKDTLYSLEKEDGIHSDNSFPSTKIIGILRSGSFGLSQKTFTIYDVYHYINIRDIRLEFTMVIIIQHNLLIS